MRLQARELNKTLLEGGASAAPPDPTKQSGIVRTGGTGDCGASWRLKALRRAQMAAEEEGKDVREVCIYIDYIYLYNYIYIYYIYILLEQAIS